MRLKCPNQLKICKAEDALFGLCYPYEVVLFCQGVDHTLTIGGHRLPLQSHTLPADKWFSLRASFGGTGTYGVVLGEGVALGDGVAFCTSGNVSAS